MADAANPLPVPTGASKTPSDFLKSIRGKPVIVKLNSGVDYRGTTCRLHTASAAAGTKLLVVASPLKHLQQRPTVSAVCAQTPPGFVTVAAIAMT